MSVTRDKGEGMVAGREKGPNDKAQSTSERFHDAAMVGVQQKLVRSGKRCARAVSNRGREGPRAAPFGPQGKDRAAMLRKNAVKLNCIYFRNVP